MFSPQKCSLPQVRPAYLVARDTASVLQKLKEMEEDRSRVEAHDMLVLLDKDVEYASRRGNWSVSREFQGQSPGAFQLMGDALRDAGYDAECVDSSGSTTGRRTVTLTWRANLGNP